MLRGAVMLYSTGRHSCIRSHSIQSTRNEYRISGGTAEESRQVKSAAEPNVKSSGRCGGMEAKGTSY
jgi:hypothetical protein